MTFVIVESGAVPPLRELHSNPAGSVGDAAADGVDDELGLGEGFEAVPEPQALESATTNSAASNFFTR